MKPLPSQFNNFFIIGILLFLMDKEDIPRFITSNLKRGLSIEEIKEQLLARNFSDYDISSAFSKLNLKGFSKKEETTPPKKTESIEGWDENLS